MAKLNKLDELISNPRWVIPVLPGGELEVLLEYSRELSKRKVGGGWVGRKISFTTNIFRLMLKANIASDSSGKA